MRPANIKAKIIFLLVCSILFPACLQPKKQIENKLKTEKLFQKEIQKENIHAAFLEVYSPSLKINWNFADGNFKSGKKVTPENPFYTASIGKTFTATAIAILKESGALQFEDEIAIYFSDDFLVNLHVFEGNDYSKEITIAQLLQHTSGLPDYFEGTTIDGSMNMLEKMLNETEKFWEPNELIEFTKTKMKALFPPGKDFHYSDTEYILLGLIVEKVSGLPLHEFFEKHLFQPLKLNQTYMNLRSEPIIKKAPISELYVGDFEVSHFKSLSADWAGGGIVSTAKDLVTFQQALFGGKIISKNTLQEMQNWIDETHGMKYGFGLRKIAVKELFPTLADLTLIGHSGLSGAFMFYCPELDIYLAGTLNQTNEEQNAMVLMVNILQLFHDINI